MPPVAERVTVVEKTQESEVLRRSEAARILGVHPNTIMSWAERGLIRTAKYPNETRYRAEDIEALRKQIFEESE